MSLVFCYAGYVDCLAFTLEHGCTVDNYMLSGAIDGGHLPCVELLVSQGSLPTPFFHVSIDYYAPENPASARVQGPVGPEQIRCLQYIIDKGCPIHPGTLILAARNGDLNYVRFLYGHGVSLWDHARSEEARQESTAVQSCSCILCCPVQCALRKTITIPCKPEDTSHMWTALLYGGLMGAPVSPAMEELFEAKRRSTCAVLLCFHVATGLSQGEGSLEQRAAWSAMGGVPMELIEMILIFASLEIPESLHRGLPAKQYANFGHI
jgi:hypothetical protein